MRSPAPPEIVAACFPPLPWRPLLLADRRRFHDGRCRRRRCRRFRHMLAPTAICSTTESRQHASSWPCAAAACGQAFLCCFIRAGSVLLLHARRLCPAAACEQAGRIGPAFAAASARRCSCVTRAHSVRVGWEGSTAAGMQLPLPSAQTPVNHHSRPPHLALARSLMLL